MKLWGVEVIRYDNTSTIYHIIANTDLEAEALIRTTYGNRYNYMVSYPIENVMGYDIVLQKHFDEVI